MLIDSAMVNGHERVIPVAVVLKVLQAPTWSEKQRPSENDDDLPGMEWTRSCWNDSSVQFGRSLDGVTSATRSTAAVKSTPRMKRAVRDWTFPNIDWLGAAFLHLPEPRRLLKLVSLEAKIHVHGGWMNQQVGCCRWPTGRPLGLLFVLYVRRAVSFTAMRVRSIWDES